MGGRGSAVTTSAIGVNPVQLCAPCETRLDPVGFVQGTKRANHARVLWGTSCHSGCAMPAWPSDFPRASRDWLGVVPRDCFLLRHPLVANVWAAGGSKVLVPGG